MYHTSHIIRTEQWIEREMGIAPQWHLFGTGPAMVEAFASQRVDLGYIGLPPAMIGIARGLPFTCIAGGHAEGTVMIAAGIRTGAPAAGSAAAFLASCDGESVGAPSRGSIHDVIARFLIQQHAPGRVDVINYPWADLMPEALSEGEISAAAGTPPLAVLARRWYGMQVAVPPRALWPFNPSYGIVVTRKLLEEQPAAVEQFLRLHENACNLIRLHPQKAAGIVASAVKVVEEDFIVEVFGVSPRYCASLPAEYITSAMDFVPVLKQMGYIDCELTAEQVFTPSVIEHVHPSVHHYGR
jgi:NitT/TauT family transport system substrate-binding protein